VAAVLLDTHALVWGQLGPHRLSLGAKNAIADADVVWVSAICFFEIAQKARLGKWPEAAGVVDGLPALHEAQGGRIAPLDAEICLSAGSLPWRASRSLRPADRRNRSAAAIDARQR
jgi:PIN domain nuclease of toxin-antitoxin system